ncbi:hypothetical protein HZC27_03120 [Candidatus Roizmanbacteria bacterium]|nr:hypothetical protein [Candidatus Roizmanbacteria bacterium]
MTEVTYGPITSTLVAVRNRAVTDLSLHTQRPLLPRRLDPFSLTLNQRGALFNLAINAWTEQDMTKIELCLQQAINGGRISEEDRIFLKEKRGFAKLSRSAYQLFDETHRPPEKLRHFTKAVGKLIDNEDVPTEQWAKIVLDAVPICQQMPIYQLCTDQSYREFLNKYTHSIGKLLQKPFLTPKLFHKLRKKIGIFMDLYRLSATLFSTQEEIQTYLFLLQLNRFLGNKHDDFLMQALKGQIHYSREQILLSDEERLLIGQFLNAVTTSS